MKVDDDIGWLLSGGRVIEIVETIIAWNGWVRVERGRDIERW